MAKNFISCDHFGKQTQICTCTISNIERSFKCLSPIVFLTIAPVSLQYLHIACLKLWTSSLQSSCNDFRHLLESHIIVCFHLMLSSPVICKSNDSGAHLLLLGSILHGPGQQFFNLNCCNSSKRFHCWAQEHARSWYTAMPHLYLLIMTLVEWDFVSCTCLWPFTYSEGFGSDVNLKICLIFQWPLSLLHCSGCAIIKFVLGDGLQIAILWSIMPNGVTVYLHLLHRVYLRHRADFYSPWV